jgi:hypothetical protein
MIGLSAQSNHFFCEYMETINASLIVLTFLLAGVVLFCSAICLAERGFKQKVAVRTIFNGFRQKMWMTVGLGVVFFSLYLLIVLLGSYFKDQSARLDFFFLMYQHPVSFIYLGLLIFACMTSGIYLVRMVIKYIYNRTHY